MKAGTLDRRIIIQSKSDVKDAYGDPIHTWSTFLTVWAMKMHLTGKEKTDNSNRSTERMMNFKVRYNGTITVEMRIIFESLTYKIEDIKELSRREGMILVTSLLTQT